MNTVKDDGYKEALWYCDDCQVWWASQSWRRATNLLVQMPVTLAKELPWDEFRGWRLHDVAVCPECRQAQEAPIYGETAVEGIYQETEIARPPDPVIEMLTHPVFNPLARPSRGTVP